MSRKEEAGLSAEKAAKFKDKMAASEKTEICKEINHASITRNWLKLD